MTTLSIRQHTAHVSEWQELTQNDVLDAANAADRHDVIVFVGAVVISIVLYFIW